MHEPGTQNTRARALLDHRVRRRLGLVWRVGAPLCAGRTSLLAAGLAHPRALAHPAGALLRRGVRALFFNGQYDMICNHAGIEASRSPKQACLAALCFVDSRRPQHFGAQRLSRSPRLTMHGGRGNHTSLEPAQLPLGETRLGDFLGTELHY